MLTYSKDEYRSFLKNLCHDDCTSDNCILKEFLTRMQPNIRMLIQLKCLEYFGKDCNEKLSGEELMKEWVTRGYAERFSDYYDDFVSKKKITDINSKEIYLKIVKGV